MLIPWETLLTTILLTPIALATTPLPPVEWSASFVLMLLYLGIPGTAVAYWAVAMASRHLPAVTTSLGLLATPVVSVITATLWLGEPLTLTLVLAVPRREPEPRPAMTENGGDVIYAHALRDRRSRASAVSAEAKISHVGGPGTPETGGPSTTPVSSAKLTPLRKNPVPKPNGSSSSANPVT